MPSLIQQISKQRPSGVHTIFVVGAACGGDLQDWRKLGSKRLVLAEAHPELATELARRIDNTRGEEVWPLAITASDQEHAVLHACNNPRFSSLQRPRELKRYFPHLKMTGETRVPARTFGTALQQALPTKDTNNLLVLAAPGQTADLIGSVLSEQLQAFRWIIVRAGAVSLYDGDDIDACLTNLKAIGFDVIQEDTDAIHPERVVLLKRDDTRVRIGQLEARVKRLIQERDAQAKAASQHKAELDKATAALTEQTKLASDRNVQIQNLTQERDAQAKAASQHKAELDNLRKQHQERGDRLAQLEAERSEQRTSSRQLSHEMIKAQAQIDLIKDVLLRDPGL